MHLGNAWSFQAEGRVIKNTEYQKVQMKAKILLCLECLEPWPKGVPTNQPCPKCGLVQDSLQRERLSLFAWESARFGYEYRLKFERQMSAAGEIREHYLLTPTEYALIAAAVAALKGWAARVAYDVIKARVIATWKKYRKKSKPGKRKRGEPIGRQADEFIKSIQDYANDLRNVDPAVKRAIGEEILTEITTKAMLEAVRNAGLQWGRRSKLTPAEEKTRIKIMAKAGRAAISGQRRKRKVTLSEFKEVESPSVAQHRRRKSAGKSKRNKHS